MAVWVAGNNHQARGGHVQAMNNAGIGVVLVDSANEAVFIVWMAAGD